MYLNLVLMEQLWKGKGVCFSALPRGTGNLEVDLKANPF